MQSVCVCLQGDAVHLRHLQVTGTLELKRKSTDVLLLMQNLRQENVNPFIGNIPNLTFVIKRSLNQTPAVAISFPFMFIDNKTPWFFLRRRDEVQHSVLNLLNIM